MNLEQAVTISTIAFLQTHAITIYHLSLEGFIMSFQFHTMPGVAWLFTNSRSRLEGHCTRTRETRCLRRFVRKAQKSHIAFLDIVPTYSPITDLLGGFFATEAISSWVFYATHWEPPLSEPSEPTCRIKGQRRV